MFFASQFRSQKHYGYSFLRSIPLCFLLLSAFMPLLSVSCNQYILADSFITITKLLFYFHINFLLVCFEKGNKHFRKVNLKSKDFLNLRLLFFYCNLSILFFQNQSSKLPFSSIFSYVHLRYWQLCISSFVMNRVESADYLQVICILLKRCAVAFNLYPILLQCIPCWRLTKIDTSKTKVGVSWNEVTCQITLNSHNMQVVYQAWIREVRISSQPRPNRPLLSQLSKRRAS